MAPKTLDPTDTIGLKILSAFPSTSSSWRPVDGIARESGLSALEVTEYISTHPNLFERAPLMVSGSVTLYRPVSEVLIGTFKKST